jgi:hypothetical protein
MKKIVTVVLFLFVANGMFSTSYRNYEMEIVNRTGGKISVVATLAPLERPWGGGTAYNIVDPPNVPVTVALGVVYGTVENPLVLLPGDEKSLFTYSYPHSKTAKAFNMMRGYDQFKIIYEDFLVFDEHGNRILDYETLAPGSFKQTYSFMKSLIVE